MIDLVERGKVAIEHFACVVFAAHSAVIPHVRTTGRAIGLLQCANRSSTCGSMAPPHAALALAREYLPGKMRIVREGSTNVGAEQEMRNVSRVTRLLRSGRSR